MGKAGRAGPAGRCRYIALTCVPLPAPGGPSSTARMPWRIPAAGACPRPAPACALGAMAAADCAPAPRLVGGDMQNEGR